MSNTAKAAGAIYAAIVKKYGNKFNYAEATIGILSYHNEIDLQLIRNGKTYNLDPPEKLITIAERLRDMMATPDGGTWYTAKFTYNDKGQYKVAFNYEDPPIWDTPLPPGKQKELFIQDFNEYPRTAQAIPEWLADIIKSQPAKTPPTTKPTSEEQPLSLAPDHIVDLPKTERNIMTAIYTMILAEYGDVFTKAVLGAVVVADASEVTLTLQTAEGALEVEPPAIEEMLDTLREITATMEGGAWFTMLTEFTRKAYKVVYDYDSKPSWYTDFSTQEEKELYRTEMRWFPRIDNLTPGWLSEILGT